MGFSMYDLVYLFVGGLFSSFMTKFAVPHIKALFSEKMLESLKNMADTITQNSLQRVREQSPNSYEPLHELEKARQEVKKMVEKHPEWWNIRSRYRRRKVIANLTSEIEKRLKLVPLMQLDCVISKLSGTIPPSPRYGRARNRIGRHGFGFAGFDTWAINRVCRKMFFYIGMLRNFPKKLDSFIDLLDKMEPFIQHIGNGINKIQRGNDASNWLNNASNWVDDMNAIIGEGILIEDTCSPIARCKRSKQITELISRIDAHLNKLSWINLELLFHEIERTRSHPRSPQIERPWSHPPPPQGTEGSTSHPPPSQETEGCTSPPPQALQDHGVCPHYNYVPGGVCPHYVLRGFCPHYNHVPREFCPHYNYVPRGFCPHYNSVGHDPCPTM